MAASDEVQKGTHHSIGAYGGMDIDAVNDYIKGAQAGVAYFNAHKPTGKVDVTFEIGEYVGD